MRLLSGLGDLRDCCLDGEKDKIVFTLPVPSCWPKEALNNLTILIGLSDLLQGCSNMTNAVMTHVSIFLQPNLLLTL